jgi:glycosyltransferase involved in cell wall biosynthesis
MANPTISIVLPTHNGSRYIDKSVESVVNQTWREWELILVDDASTDGTPAKIERWARSDDRITAIHLPNNRKLPGALNDGFARANGEFHTWTSDDNWYHPQALARMIEVLRSDERIGIVHADAIAVDEYGSFMGQARSGSAADLHVMNRIGACFLYRRQVTLALGGYDEDLAGAEDYDFWLRAAVRFRYRHLGEFLYFYRCHSASLTARKCHLIAKNVEQAVRRWLPQYAWPDESTRIQAHIEWGVRCLTAGTWEERYEPWLQEAEWIAPEVRRRMRREVLRRAVQLAKAAYYRRDWEDFKRYRPYLLEVCDEPEVARFLASRLYPKWVYHAKDRLCGMQRRLRSWKAWLVGDVPEMLCLQEALPRKK